MGLSLNIGKLITRNRSVLNRIFQQFCMKFSKVIFLCSSCVCIYLFHILMCCGVDMASAAFIEPLPVIEFVAQLLGKDILSRPLSDSDRVKVL